MKIKLNFIMLVMITFLWTAACVPQGAQPSDSLIAATEKTAAAPPTHQVPPDAKPATFLSETPDISVNPTEPAQMPSVHVQAEAGPLEFAENFMNWYVGYMKDNQSLSGEIFYPFEEGAHEDIDLFTETFITRVNEILAVPVLERGQFDPVMHQWGFIEDYSLVPVFIDEQTAVIAVKLEGYDLPSWAGATLDLVRSDTSWKIDDIHQENITTPVGVTKLFYNWYFESHLFGENPLKNGAYKSSEYLSDSFISRVAESQLKSENTSLDPFVLSTEIPTGASILEEAVVVGNKATVMLWRYFFSSQHQPLVVFLEKYNETWKIVDVSLEKTPLNPTEIVQAFYEWYLDYIKPDSNGDSQNALVVKAYQDSPYLAETFIKKLDQRDQTYDPLLCAQDIPTSITTDGFFIEKLNAPDEVTDASVVVTTSFPGHIFTVDLVRPGGKGDEWKIEDVTCSNSPEGTVKAFYTWYQSCQEGSTSCRTPSASEIYARSGLITDDFVNRVEALQNEYAKSGGGIDPILMGQSTFYAFDVEKVYQTDSKARVILHNLSTQTTTDQGLLVSLVVDGAYWKIDNVTQHLPNSPEQIAVNFYTWYSNILHEGRNPQVTYGFEAEAYLSADYIQEVGVDLNRNKLEGYNQILLHDRLPERFEVGELKEEGDVATLQLLRYFEGEGSSLPMTVFMEKIDGWWVITGAEEK